MLMLLTFQFPLFPIVFMIFNFIVKEKVGQKKIDILTGIVLLVSAILGLYFLTSFTLVKLKSVNYVIIRYNIKGPD